MAVKTFKTSRIRWNASAFTLVEILIAITIFSLILAAIFSSWTAILRSSKTGLNAAAAVQRTRISLRMLEDSLGSAQSFGANLPLYAFVAQNGDEAALSFVARLSESFPRSGKFGEFDVRRLTFTVESAPDSTRQLVLRQSPILMDPDEDEQKHPIVLAKNVKGFELQFWDTQKNDWVDKWDDAKTNQLPKLVMITLKTADNSRDRSAQEQVTRIISLPSVTVQPIWQAPRIQGQPNQQNPNQNNPNNPNNPNFQGNPNPNFNNPNQFQNPNQNRFGGRR